MDCLLVVWSSRRLRVFVHRRQVLGGDLTVEQMVARVGLKTLLQTAIGLEALDRQNADEEAKVIARVQRFADRLGEVAGGPCHNSACCFSDGVDKYLGEG